MNIFKWFFKPKTKANTTGLVPYLYWQAVEITRLHWTLCEGRFTRLTEEEFIEKTRQILKEMLREIEESEYDGQAEWLTPKVYKGKNNKDEEGDET